MLRRLGNKTKLAPLITKYFPPHEVYIEMFCGALGMYLNKPKAKYNFLNDLDNDVFNFWTVLKENRDLLEQRIYETPYCEAIFKYWLKNKEIDNIWQAVRFVYLSNFSYLGTKEILRFGRDTSKNLLLSNFTKTFEIINDCQFLNCDFKEVLKKIAIMGSGRSRLDYAKSKVFIYADPPYLSTTDNYSNSFTEQDAKDLFELLVNSGIRFAISEFDNPIIRDLAKQYNLKVIPICERQTLKSRNTEILIMNYVINNTMFDNFNQSKPF